jgi:hypothetical protein
MIIQKADIKDRFPLWDEFCTVADSALTADEQLDQVIVDSEAELSRFITVDETTATDVHKLYYMSIIRYRCFILRHGDDEFKHPPQIVKDYSKALTELEKLRQSDAAGNSNSGLSVTAKDRLFGPGSWFTN